MNLETSSIKNILWKISRKELNRVLRFKDLHQGNTCYIIGDGVSIKWFDLGAFPKYPAITLNYFLFHRDFKKIKTLYSILPEPWFFYSHRKTPHPPYKWCRNRIQKRYREFINEYRNINYFVNLSNYPVLNYSNIFHKLLVR